MARFEYEAIYNGRDQDDDLVRDLKKVLNKASNKLKLSPLECDGRYVSGWTIPQENREVQLGIREAIKFATATGQAYIAICGEEKDILATKSKLLSVIRGLELH